MTLEEAQRRLNEALARENEWLIQNSDAVPPPDITRPVRVWQKIVASLRKDKKQ